MWKAAKEYLKEELKKADEILKFDGSKRNAKTVESFTKKQRVIAQDLEMVNAFDRGAGSLWAGSGFRVQQETRFGLDWALVRLPKHRPTLNLVSFSLCLLLHIYIECRYVAALHLLTSL